MAEPNPYRGPLIVGTSLNRRLLGAAAVVVVALAAGVPARLACALALAGCVLAFVTHRRPNPKTTVQDRLMICLERIASGQLHSDAQVSCVLHIDCANMPPDFAEHGRTALARTVNACPRFGRLLVAAPSSEEATFAAPEGGIDYGQHVVEYPHVVEAAHFAHEVNKLIGTPLRRDIPAWRFDVVRSTGRRGCVLFRTNHANADGLRLLKAGAHFMKFADGSPCEIEMLKKMDLNKVGKVRRSVLGILADLVEAATMEHLPLEDPNPFKPPGAVFPGNSSRLNVESVMSFATIQAVRNACPAGTTINDVVLSCFCAALSRYADEVGEPLIPGALLRSLCAVSMPDRRSKDPASLYNNFVLPSMHLPILPATGAAAERTERLAAVRRVMQHSKNSLAGWWLAKLVTLATRLGLESIIGKTQNAMFARHAFVYSNVPGFTQPVYLFAAPDEPARYGKIEQFGVFYENLNSQIIFMSYNGTFSMSLSTDPAVLSQPQLLCDLFVKEVLEWCAQACDGTLGGVDLAGSGRQAA